MTKNGIFCVVDTETTGLKPDYNEVIQVACIVCSPLLEVIGDISFKLHPEHIERASAKALEVNGYDVSTWNAKFSAHDEAWRYFNKQLKKINKETLKTYMIGQNVSFDYNFLYNEYLRNDISFPFEKQTVDLIEVAKIWTAKAGVTLNSYKLANLAKLTGYTNYNPHDALADAEVTLNALKWFVNDLERRGAHVGL